MSGLGARLRRALLCLLTLGSSAACAPDFDRGPLAAPPGETIGTHERGARLDRDAIITADGARLALRVWLPQGNVPPRAAMGVGAPPRAVILALHGFNDYSRAFEMPAATWAKQGIATYAYDQRGFGANADPGRWAGGRTLCLDLAAAVTLVQRRWPGVPVFLLGESMGGAEALAALGGTCAGTAPPRPAGLILVAPAVWGRQTMPAVNRVALWSAARLFPSATFTGEGFHVLASDNFPMLRQLGRDPLFIKATRSDTIFGLVDMMDAAYATAPITAVPVLLLYGAHDELIPVDPMRRVARRLADAPGNHVTIAYYPHGWHMLLRDREHERVAQDVAHWIGAPEASLPSGADRLGRDFLAGRLPRPHPSSWSHRPAHERG